jgi:hypothetical protein
MLMSFREFMHSLAVRGNDVVRVTFPNHEQHKGHCLLMSRPIKAAALRAAVERCYCTLPAAELSQLQYARVEVLA